METSYDSYVNMVKAIYPSMRDDLILGLQRKVTLFDNPKLSVVYDANGIETESLSSFGRLTIKDKKSHSVKISYSPFHLLGVFISLPEFSMRTREELADLILNRRKETKTKFY